MRPSFEQIFMNFAIAIAQRSHHPKTRVGCVITSYDHTRVVAIGYNGHEKGGYNHLKKKKPGESEMVHAEINALIKCRDDGFKNIYLTVAPCITCAKAIINANNFINVYYHKAYRDKRGIGLLQSHGIRCKKVK